MLWTGAMYLLKNNKPHWICSVPAMFMSAVVCMYIFYAPEGFNLNYNLALIIGSILTLTIIGWFIKQIISQRKDNEQASKVA
jgi:carbon starvation protein CstA